LTLADLAVYCADVGSVAAGHFGWAGDAQGDRPWGNDPAALAQAVAGRLKAGRPVALGFECPLFVPLSADPAALSAARDGEGSRPWSAGAGAAALATGLTQVAWLLRRVRAEVRAPAFLKWGDFCHAGNGLFLWEAFVTGVAEGADPVADAVLAVDAFRRALPDPTVHNAVTTADAYSLVGAALLRTGWKTHPSVLATPALVIGAPRGG
jgi:hypothetical protein